LDENEISDDIRIEIDAFRALGKTPEVLYGEASVILGRFKTGSMIMGGFLGFMLGMLLLGLTRFYHRTDYVPNRGRCLSCGRCMDYCPVDRTTENNYHTTEHA
jgi:ferredoxin